MKSGSVKYCCLSRVSGLAGVLTEWLEQEVNMGDHSGRADLVWSLACNIDLCVVSDYGTPTVTLCLRAAGRRVKLMHAL